VFGVCSFRSHEPDIVCSVVGLLIGKLRNQSTLEVHQLGQRVMRKLPPVDLVGLDSAAIHKGINCISNLL